jgi:hypothetical protein
MQLSALPSSLPPHSSSLSSLPTRKRQFQKDISELASTQRRIHTKMAIDAVEEKQ